MSQPGTFPSPRRRTAIPRVQRAVVATGPGKVALRRDILVPEIRPDEVLVRVAAVALNPSDYKLLDISVTIGATSGSDAAGTVVKVGSDVRKPLKVGDRVFGVVFGANPGRPGNGAWADYVAMTADLCISMPVGMDFEKAASLGMALMTVGLTMRALKLEYPNTDSERSEHSNKRYALIYGGATATGSIAIQLFHKAGYAVITTCSPRNFELVKNRGAVAAFDYKAISCKEDIRKFAEGNLAYALDCIADSASLSICFGAIGDAGGHYIALEQYPKRLTIRRRNVKHGWVLGWTIFGQPVNLGGAYARPAIPEDLEFSAEWALRMETLLENGQIECHPIDIAQGRKELIPRLDLLRCGKVLGKKLVVKMLNER